METMNSLSKASGRKRRAESPPDSPRASDNGNSDTVPQPIRSSALMKTPKKVKKKVRFSDPGPQTLSPGSTGITPFVSRTSLLAGMGRPAPSTPRLLARAPRRRASMPAESTSFQLGSSSNPIEVYQFTPLRQILTPRTQRQLKRNNISEEMNNIEAEKRSVLKLQREVQTLKEALALTKQPGEPSAADEAANAQRIRDLEEEIVELKQEQSSSVEADIDMTMINDADSVDLLRSESGYGTASPSIIDEDHSMTIPSSPSPSMETAATTPAQHSPKTTCSAGVQTDITSQSLSTLYSYAQSQTKHLTRARLSLERLYPGETALGLSLTGDASPLLDQMLSRLSESQAQLGTCRASLAASQTQESNLGSKFNASLKQLDEARAAHAKLLRDTQQTNSTQVFEANERITQLESEIKDYEKNHLSLTSALDKYRNDVRDLELLFHTLETEHAGAVSRLQAERDTAVQQIKEQMDEAVADLSCMVAAEMRGRHEAESECDSLGLKAEEAKNREHEVRGALNEKQNIVRELEFKMENMQRSWEKEVGGLNARVGQLCAEVETKKDELQIAEREVRRLVDCVQDEKDAGRRSLEGVMRGIDQCKSQAEGIGRDFAQGADKRGERVVTALGLLTPTVEGGRFRDVQVGSESVEGAVEVARGKAARRKVDSVIGILLEDGGEE